MTDIAALLSWMPPATMLKWRQAGESGHGSSRNAHSTAVVGNM